MHFQHSTIAQTAPLFSLPVELQCNIFDQLDSLHSVNELRATCQHLFQIHAVSKRLIRKAHIEETTALLKQHIELAQLHMGASDIEPLDMGSEKQHLRKSTFTEEIFRDILGECRLVLVGEALQRLTMCYWRWLGVSGRAGFCGQPIPYSDNKTLDTWTAEVCEAPRMLFGRWAKSNKTLQRQDMMEFFAQQHENFLKRSKHSTAKRA